MEPTTAIKKLLSFSDQLGPWMAGLCVLHCLALPAVLALSASAAISLLSWKHPFHPYATFLLNVSRWEVAWLGLGVAATLVSLLLGFRRHRRRAPAAWLLAAATVFAFAFVPMSASPWTHAILMAVGSLLLVVATIHDRRLRRMP